MNAEPITGIVVGYDGSADGTRALDWAIGEAAARGLPLTDLASLNAAAERRLARMLAPLRELHPEVDARAEVVAGSPRDVLMKAAADARLVAVGSRGLGGFRGLLLGSISHALVQHAPCSVAVVHAPR